LKLLVRKHSLTAKVAENYDDDFFDEPSAYVTYGNQPMTTYQQVTTKIPPMFNGTTSWFAYEEAIEDWCDITELDAEKRGPALRNRLEGDAAVYRSLLDRDQFRDAQNGEIFQKQFKTTFYQEQPIRVPVAVPATF